MSESGTEIQPLSALAGHIPCAVWLARRARALARVKAGDTLVVISLDRLARSLSHLLDVIESLQARGAFFRSLRDPVDTASP
jgi:hypothetical protein